MRHLGVTLLVASIVLAVLGCGNESEQARAPSELVGVIVRIERNDGEVGGLALRSDGETYDVLIARDVDYGFDLDHLEEHRATGDPVRVRLEERDNDLYALEIADA